MTRRVRRGEGRRGPIPASVRAACPPPRSNRRCGRGTTSIRRCPLARATTRAVGPPSRRVRPRDGSPRAHRRLGRTSPSCFPPRLRHRRDPKRRRRRRAGEVGSAREARTAPSRRCAHAAPTRWRDASRTARTSSPLDPGRWSVVRTAPRSPAWSAARSPGGRRDRSAPPSRRPRAPNAYADRWCR